MDGTEDKEEPMETPSERSLACSKMESATIRRIYYDLLVALVDVHTSKITDDFYCGQDFDKQEYLEWTWAAPKTQLTFRAKEASILVTFTQAKGEKHDHEQRRFDSKTATNKAIEFFISKLKLFFYQLL
jgi:hypothetical protein